MDEIVLVGGSTRIPKVQQLIKDGGNPGRPKYDPEIHPKIILSFELCMFIYLKDFQTIILTLRYSNIALENGPFEDVFPIKDGDIPLLC